VLIPNTSESSYRVWHIPFIQTTKIIQTNIFTHQQGTGNNQLLPAWDFTGLFKQFSIHPGRAEGAGRGAAGLGFTDDDMEASHMTLHRFRNMASSSMLYELAYIEGQGEDEEG
jgi:hypothetical protein